MGRAHERDAVVAKISGLVERARVEGAPVVWVQHSGGGMEVGSDAWAYVPELVQRGGEPVVHKHYSDAFEATTLEQVLAERCVGRLVVVGADGSVRTRPHCGHRHG